MSAPICPSCGRMAFTTMTRYGKRSSCCGLWSWDEAPLADAETHAARQAAHAAFDPLWKSKMMRRSEAYAALAKELGIPFVDCHMKLMDAETAHRVPAAVERIIRKHEDDGMVIEE